MYYLRCFSTERCFKVWNTETANCNNENFPDFKALKSFDCIIGHLDFASSIKNEAFKELFFFNKIVAHSVVRDPIDRMISLYNYVRNEENHPSHQRMLSVEPWDFLQYQPENYQSKWLGIGYFKTIENLKMNIKIVPLEKSNEYFKKFFEKEFSFKTTLTSKINVTKKVKKDLFDRELLKDNQERELREKHFLDYELYEFSFQ